MAKSARHAPSRTEEGSVLELKALAMKQARTQLEQGVAPPSIVNYFLKLGDKSDDLDIEKKEKEIELLKAKIQSLEKESNQTEIYQEAVDAFRNYGSGNSSL